MGNANSGARPKPTSLKVLLGNPGQRRLNEKEPIPPGGDVVKPEGLSAGAGKVWEELAPICRYMGTLTPADIRPLAMLCELEASVAQARVWKQKPRTMAKGLKLEKELAAIIRPYYALFGLEPSSRARLSVAKPPEAPVSKWAGVLK